MIHKEFEHLCQEKVKQNSLLRAHCKAKSYCFPKDPLLSMAGQITSGDQQQRGTV